MRVALYARVSTDVQEARGSIGSQLQTLREWAVREAHDLVAEYVDDGCSGARLDRPGLDSLRDSAERGLFEAILCLTPDRLARSYPYQFLVLEELARHGVRVLFFDAPDLDNDPQVRLLTEMQGVIAEYERAKIAERNRRGRLFRARSGEVVHHKVPYGYRRVGRSRQAPAHLEVFEPEAVVVRRIFDDYVGGGHSMRQIAWRLYEAAICSPSGLPAWRYCSIAKILHNTAYVGTLYCNCVEVLAPQAGRKRQQRKRPQAEWIAISVPTIVSQETFDAAQQVRHDNSRFSPRRAEPGRWLLRSLVRCGPCGVITKCLKTVSGRPRRTPTALRYYVCPHRDPLRAGGDDLRCREHGIRADELDAFVFAQVREALLQPEMLLAGEAALASRTPAPDDELLAAQLGRLNRRLEAADAERRRLVDVYQTGLLQLAEFENRTREVDERRRRLAAERDELTAQRQELVKDNRLRQHVDSFAQRVVAKLDNLDFPQRQQLLRLVVEEVRVTGWQVEIRLRIPLDEVPANPKGPPPPSQRGSGPQSSTRVSSKDGLRLLRTRVVTITSTRAGRCSSAYWAVAPTTGGG
jgi:site-specific DNA recombinase